MEILDASTQEVWQTLQVVTLEDHRALDVGDAFRKVGIASGAMDASYFRRSPGADADGPMRTMEFGGHTWSYCARPELPPTQVAGEKGPMRLPVDKHHTLIFDAGRSLPVLRTPDGDDYVHTIAARPGAESLLLPDG